MKLRIGKFQSCFVDHERVVLEGKKYINKSLVSGNDIYLKNYLSGLEFNPVKTIVEVRQERLDKLVELKAPQGIIDFEISALAMVTGSAYTSSGLKDNDFDQLRDKLINLFIPWRGFECFFNMEAAKTLKMSFPKRDNLPEDSSGHVLVAFDHVEDENSQNTERGYLSPDEVSLCPEDFPVVDVHMHDPSYREVYVDFISRADTEKYGIYYQIDYDVISQASE